MTKLILIFLASGVGGVLRFVIGGWSQHAGMWVWAKVGGSTPRDAFPLGTMVVNLTGCFTAGLLAALFAGPWPIREEYRTAILVGVLGGYTTFSAFGRETMTLVEQRQWTMAGANVVLSVALGLAGVWAGTRVGEIVTPG